jgi:hypothetical protein
MANIIIHICHNGLASQVPKLSFELIFPTEKARIAQYSDGLTGWSAKV